MSKRSAELADQFEQAVNDFAKEVEACNDAEWSAVCNDEGWTVAQTAQHVAGQFPLEMTFITACAEGKPLPSLTWPELNEKNETRAANNAKVTQADVVSELRAKAATAAAYVRGLSDDQLDRTGALGLADGASVSTEQLIRGGVLIEHVTGHLGSIRTASAPVKR
jgi:hypothetical protein